MDASDTIVAHATPRGESALAIVRLSGPDCPEIAQKCMGVEYLEARKAVYGAYRGLGGEIEDRCVFLYYQKEASSTGEDVLEIFTHGNPLIVQRIIQDLIARGCRAAEPGEFTRRAFLNGKMDLTQAEAVLDLIHARSSAALAAAQRQLDGSVGRAIQSLLERLLRIRAHVEAYIDFPEEDLPIEDPKGPYQTLRALAVDVERLAATAPYSALLHDGVRTVIAGAPNAGKSSLLNALLGEDRAIVSPEPGTTRDYIEDRIIVGPHLLRIVDTAGLRSASGEVETQGIERSLRQIERADIVLLVLDSTQPAPPLPRQVADSAALGKLVVIANKCDLPGSCAGGTLFEGIRTLRLSALTGEGLDELRRRIVELIETRIVPEADGAVLVGARHAEALRAMLEALRNALEKLSNGGPAELVASDLNSAAAALEQILGRIDNEKMLDQLFANFCIGK